MKAKYFYLFIISILLFSQNCFNQEINQTLNDKFQEANYLYNDSKYEKSIEKYFEIIDAGFHSPELYFNLANSYYKINDIPNSILFYEKSLKLNQSDQDVLNNLEMVNNALVDDISEVPESFIDLKLNQLSSLLTYSNWGTLSILLSFGFLSFFVIYLFSIKPLIKRITFVSLFVFLFTTIITSQIALQSYEKNYLEEYAIIFSAKIEIKAEPNERSDNLVTLHQGTKVKIIDNFNNQWIKIKLVNGQEGWISKNEIKII